jgi:hypothetical protein
MLEVWRYGVRPGAAAVTRLDRIRDAADTLATTWLSSELLTPADVRDLLAVVEAASEFITNESWLNKEALRDAVAELEADE